ncbi:hypothetical protein Tco_1322277 [Tanacetum coccineum]
MGPSVPSSSPKGRNKISRSEEKLCVTLFQGWTIRIAKALSFPDASLFFAAFGCVDIGEGVLNLPLSKAKISFGDFMRSVNLSRLRFDLCWIFDTLLFVGGSSLGMPF